MPANDLPVALNVSEPPDTVYELEGNIFVPLMFQVYEVAVVPAGMVHFSVTTSLMTVAFKAGPVTTALIGGTKKKKKTKSVPNYVSIVFSTCHYFSTFLPHVHKFTKAAERDASWSRGKKKCLSYTINS